MFPAEALILIASVLILLGIASSKFSARAGIPVLVLFLILGMLAGSEGIGGINFEDYELAYGVGTLALTLILFDGGLSTPLSAFQTAWKPASALATLGVLLTSAIMGAAAAWVLGLKLIDGMLLGSIVGSTDAAAVFAVLRSGGIRLPGRLSSTLEVESGSNDPMAIFLTIGLIGVIRGDLAFGPELLGLFATQAIGGTVIGLGVGFLGVQLINRIRLESAGLYPVLATAVGMLAYGLTVAFDGSGFLAVYLAGIVLGNSRLVFKRGIFLFHDAGAWLAQIVMFVVLGLLSFPSRLVDVAPQGLLLAAVLVFVARPVAVGLTLLPFRFTWRELIFLSWGGLKGAVPITLATFPFLFQIANANRIFDVVFFVVLVSALFQGWTLPILARKLGLQRPPEPSAPVTLELTSLRHVDGDIVDYYLNLDSRAASKMVRELALPEGAVIALIARGDRVIPPKGSTRILPGDHVIVVLGPGTRPLVDRVFAQGAPGEALPRDVEFPLRATSRVGDLEACYGFSLHAPPEATLEQAIMERLGPKRPEVGCLVPFGPVALRIRELDDSGRIDGVGMVIVPIDPEAPPTFSPPQRRGTRWWIRPSNPRM
ncbi:potassium/proton antiporter [Tautonia rosea]|uniref:potassium/proton antiporter n=1 Tax=Tautonia rosea TaxID=2728037 RepID=UPI001475C4C6